MKIKVNTPMVDLKGNPITDLDEKTGKKKEWILKDVLISSLITTHFTDGKPEQVSQEEQTDRYKLAVQLETAKDEINLKPEDAALLKKLVSKSFSVLVTGQVCEILDK